MDPEKYMVGFIVLMTSTTVVDGRDRHGSGSRPWYVATFTMVVDGRDRHGSWPRPCYVATFTMVHHGTNQQKAQFRNTFTGY